MVSNALMVVEPAPRLAPAQGLFSVVPFRPEGNGHWGNGVTWESLSCAVASGIGDPNCEPTDPQGPTEAVGLPKGDAAPADNGEASPFTVYFKEKCSPLGRAQQAQDRATQSLLTKEQYRVEQALWTGDLGNTPNFQVAPVGLPSSDPRYVLGMLTKGMRQEVGMGVLHVGLVGAAVLLDHRLLVVSSSGAVTTVFGDQVVIGSGYPEFEGGPILGAAAAGNAWVVMTPPLLGYRSEVFTSSERVGDLLDRGKNDMYGVAERSYVLGFDPCGVAVAQMSVYETGV